MSAGSGRRQPPGWQLKVVTRRHPSPWTPQCVRSLFAFLNTAHIFPSPDLYLCVSFSRNTSRNCHSASGHSQAHPLPKNPLRSSAPSPGPQRPPQPRPPLAPPSGRRQPRGLHRARAVADRVSGPTPRHSAETEGARPGPAVSGGRRERGWGRFEPLAAGLAPLRGTGSRRPRRGPSRAVPPRAPAAPQGRARALRG